MRSSPIAPMILLLICHRTLSSTACTTAPTTPSQTAVAWNTPSPIDSTLRSGCDGTLTRNWTSSTGHSTFHVACSKDADGHDFAVSLGILSDAVHSLDGCMELCASINEGSKKPLCNAVTFGTGGTIRNVTGCYLKSGSFSILNLKDAPFGNNDYGADAALLVQ